MQERMTSERVNGIKSGYWSPARKEELVQRLAEYENIGTVEKCREAVENQKAKNPSVHKQQYSDAYNCSKCGWTFIHKNETGWFCGQHYKFCPNCGQAIRWNENLEGMGDE